MNYRHSKIFMFLIFLLFFLLGCTSKNLVESRSLREKIARDQVRVGLAKRGFDTTNIMMQIVDVDSSIGVNKKSSSEIHDPYGTLKTCFIFMIHMQSNIIFDSSNVVGVLKDGKILWVSRLFSAGSNGSIYATIDLNHDGKVDIVSIWFQGFQDVSDLWIHSWDGHEGKSITNLTEESTSEIIGTSEFNFIDIDNDGILEIISTVLNASSDAKGAGTYKEIYKWNGSKYAKWKKQ